MADDVLLDQLAQPLEEPPPKRVARFSHTIAFRLTDEQMIAADALRQTFPSGTWAEAMQWIFSSARGRQMISERVKGEV